MGVTTISQLGRATKRRRVAEDETIGGCVAGYGVLGTLSL